MASKTVHSKAGKANWSTVSGKPGAPHSSTAAEKSRKHVLLNQPRLKKAQELLGAKTESETIERALERVITDAERDKDAWAAHERFVKNIVKDDVEFLDAFGRLER